MSLKKLFEKSFISSKNLLPSTPPSSALQVNWNVPKAAALAAVWCTFIFLIPSCKKESMIAELQRNTNLPQVSLIADVKVNELGYLEFKSPKAFR